MNIPTYKDKTFVIEDNETRVRRADDLSKFETYKGGDTLPAGAQVGDFKIIPRRTQVNITDTRIDSARTVYVFARPSDAASDAPSGWTKAANLEGRFLNEIIGWTPPDWDLPPLGNNFTVTDKNALLRGGPPDFKSKASAIAQGTFVVVTEKSKGTSPPAKFLRVSRAVIAGGQVTAGEELGWTAAANLTDGCSQAFTAKAWTDTKGANACWRAGSYIGAKVLVNIVGAGSEMEQITLESLDPYFRLREAAKPALDICIESGFRTYQKQEELFNLFQAGKGNLAAKPGRSNHQHGQAFDLNTHGFDADPLYAWLKKNAPRFGFIRTVNKEHWHWEYLPEIAATLAKQGKFKLDKVVT
jgi:hypothetical protein